MTLIITVATRQKVIQASDRRLTRPDGSFFSDDANKAVCIGCKDAYFCIGYTGLAFIEGMKTDEWLVESLMSIQAYKMDISSVTVALEKMLTVGFASSLKQYRSTTFVLAGYRNGLPFAAIISNFEKEDVWPPSEAEDAFKSHVWWMNKRSKSEIGYWISINGTRQAVSRSLLRRFKRLIQNGYFRKSPSEVIGDQLVALIREAAQEPRFGQYIGRNCMAVTMSVNPNEGFVCKYYPDEISSFGYTPYLIMPPGIAVKGVQFWKGKGSPPWRRRPQKP